MSVTEMTRLWDKGSKTQRAAILTNFIKRHRHSTAAEIDRDLGHGAMLFFTRITAWLRLTYQLGHSVSLQLSALSIFLQGQKYLSQFMEVGGIQALTDVVCICKANRQDDKNNALLLLLHIANSGRVYREMICDGDGVNLLVAATVTEHDERTLELLASLYLALGQGNPRKASTVHAGLLVVMHDGEDDGALCAATTLRSLQLAKQAYVGDPGAAGMVGVDVSDGGAGQSRVLDALFHLLQSANVKLRFEGMELLSIAAQNHSLLGPVIRRCLETLETSEVSFDADPGALLPVRRLKSSCGRIVCNILLSPMGLDQAEQVLLLVDRYSAHLTLAKHLRLCEGRDVPGSVEACKALRALAVGPYQAARSLDVSDTVSRAVSSWLRKRLGDDLFEHFTESPVLADELALRVAGALLTYERQREEAADQQTNQQQGGDTAAAAADESIEIPANPPPPPSSSPPPAAASETPTRSEIFSESR